MPSKRDNSLAKLVPKGGIENHLSSASQSTNLPFHNTEPEGAFNLGDDVKKKRFIGIKTKAAETAKNRSLIIEKPISKSKGKCTDTNQRNTEKGEKTLNNNRRSSRQRRPAWKTVEMGNSETLKCHLKFHKMKSESDFTRHNKSQTTVLSKCINPASCSLIPPSKGDMNQKKAEQLQHEYKSPYSISQVPKPDYNQHARQSKKRAKFKCSPTSLKHSPGGAKERAKRYINRKRKRRAVELVGKYRKKKLRSNQSSGYDLWEGFPFNLQMPRYKSEQKSVQSDSQTEGLQAAKETLSEIVKQEISPADGVQQGEDRNSENGHADHANNLTFTITKEKKRNRRHRKRKKQHRSSPKSEQSMGCDPAKVKETLRSGTKTVVSTTPTDRSREAVIHHPWNDLEASSREIQHHRQGISKSSKGYPDYTQYQGDFSARSGDDKVRDGSMGKKREAKAHSLALTKPSHPVISQNGKTKQKLKKKVKFSSFDTTAGNTEVGDENGGTVPSIKLTVTKAERADKDSNDHHAYRVVVNGVNSHKQINKIAKKSGKVQTEKTRTESERIRSPDEASTRDEHITNTEEHAIKTFHEASPLEIKNSKEEREGSQVDITSGDGYYKLLLDPNNRRPTQYPIKIKLERSYDSQPATSTASVPNCKLDILTEVDVFSGKATPIEVAAQGAEKPVLGEDASTSKHENEASLRGDDSLFCPEDEEADDESDCEGKEMKRKQKKCIKTKSTLKVKLPSIRFTMEGNRREGTLKEVSSDEEGTSLSTQSSNSSNTENVQTLPSPNHQQGNRTIPKKAKCQKSSTDPKLKCTDAPLMQKSRRDCTDWRLLSPSSKHRNVRRVSSEGKISSNPMPSPHDPSTSERCKRTTSFGSRVRDSSTSEANQQGLPASGRPMTRRLSMESKSENLLEGLLQVSPKKQVPAVHSHLFDDKRLGIHACALWSSGNRRHYQMKHPDANGEDLDKMMRDAWEKLSKKEKLQYYKRASNATADQKKSTTASLKKAVVPSLKPKPPAPLQTTSKPPKPPQDDFYSLSAPRQEDILLHKLQCFQSTLSPYHYNKFLYEFITSFKRSVRSFRHRKAAWLDDPIERGFQYASVSRRILYNKMKQYENLVGEVRQHKQFLAYKHHKLQYDDTLWKLITGAPVQFDDSAHSDRLTLVLEAIEEVEQNMNRNASQIPHQDHGKGEPNLVSTCLCRSEMERRGVQEIAEDLKHSCSTSGTIKVRIDNRDIIIPRIAMDSRLNQQLLSEFDHNVPLQELEAEDVDGFLDGLGSIVADTGDDVLLYQDFQIPRVSTPLDEVLRPSTPLDDVPRVSTPLYDVPRASTPLYDVPRASKPLDDVPRESTYSDAASKAPTFQDEIIRAGSHLDGKPRVSTALDKEPSSSTPVDELPKVSTAPGGMPKEINLLEKGPMISKTLTVTQRVSRRQEEIPKASQPVVTGMPELTPSPLEEAWNATYRCIHGLEQCCPLDSPSCILSSLLVDKIMTRP